MFYLLTQRDKLKRLPEDAAILETAMIHHMSDAESDTEKGLFHRILPWRDNHLKDLIRRCNVSRVIRRTSSNVSAVNAAIKKNKCLLTLIKNFVSVIRAHDRVCSYYFHT